MSESIKNDLERLARRWAGWTEEAVARNALALIEQLEEQVCLMKIQMHGDCGVCKHRSGCQINGRDITMSKTCYECMMKESRPNWEYEGLPEVKSR